MIQVLQEALLVVLMVVLLGVRHETVRDVPKGQQAQFHETRSEDPQVQPEFESYAWRDSSVAGGLFLPVEGPYQGVCRSQGSGALWSLHGVSSGQVEGLGDAFTARVSVP